MDPDFGYGLNFATREHPFSVFGSWNNLIIRIEMDNRFYRPVYYLYFHNVQF